MEKRYLVKHVSVATECNPNFAGQVLETLHGRGDKILSASGSHAEAVYIKSQLWRGDVLEYGYKRECDARKCWSYKNSQNDKFWQTEVSIIEMEV